MSGRNKGRIPHGKRCGKHHMKRTLPHPKEHHTQNKFKHKIRKKKQ